MTVSAATPLERIGDKIADAAWFVFMMNPVRVIIGLAILFAIGTNFGVNYYYGKWIGFGAVSTLLLSIHVAKRYGVMAAVTLAYLLGHIIWFLFYPENRYSPVKAYDLTALKLFMAESGLKLLLVIAPLMTMKINRADLKEVGGQFVCAFALMNLVSVAFQWMENGCNDVNSCGGILMNPSMNATMAAVALPFVFKHFPRPIAWGVLAATTCAAVMGGTSLGLGMIAAFLVLLNPRLFLVAPALLGLGWYFFGSVELFSSGDRWPVWSFFMEQWVRNPVHWWFGTGFGSFGVLSINLQNAHAFRDQYWWIWMHNDWLQALFELGGVGLSLLLGTFLAAVRGLWLRRELFELRSLLLFGLAMLVNYPLHLGLPCVFAGWLVLLALEKENPHNNL